MGSFKRNNTYKNLQIGFWSIDYEILFPDFTKFCYHLLLIITNSKWAKDKANN